MIGSAAASKRAAAFAGALDEHELDEAGAADRTVAEGRSGAAPPAPVRPAGASGPAASPSEEDEHAGEALLLQLAERLRSVPRPALAPDVKTVQRAQLVAAMEAQFASPEARARQVPPQRDGRGSRARGAHRAPAVSPLSRLRPNSRLGKGIAAGGLSVGVAASAFGGVASASSDALPGDSLYGFKRGMEDIRLDLADDEADRGRLHLDRAATRLREARRLMERTRGGAELDEESAAEVRRTLSGMRHDATEGHRLLSTAYERDGNIAPMRSLSSFSSEHRASWRKLQQNLPPQLSDVREDVSSVFESMDSDIAPIAGLIDEASEEEARGHKTDGAGRHRKGSKPPLPSSSSASESAEGRDGGTGAPDPSGSDGPSGELIGGNGLLDPPGDPHGRPSLPGAGGGGRSDTDSEVTLPPIVPDVLPGLNRPSGDGS